MVITLNQNAYLRLTVRNYNLFILFCCCCCGSIRLLNKYSQPFRNRSCINCCSVSVPPLQKTINDLSQYLKAGFSVWHKHTYAQKVRF